MQLLSLSSNSGGGGASPRLSASSFVRAAHHSTTDVPDTTTITTTNTTTTTTTTTTTAGAATKAEVDVAFSSSSESGSDWDEWSNTEQLVWLSFNWKLGAGPNVRPPCVVSSIRGI